MPGFQYPSVIATLIAGGVTGIGSPANGLSIASNLLSLHLSDASHTGALASTDWSTFNAKQSALTLGNLTAAGTDGIVVTAGTGAIVGAGTSLAQHVADASHNGYLTSTDWSAFNGKLSLSGGTMTGNINVGATIMTGTDYQMQFTHGLDVHTNGINVASFYSGNMYWRGSWIWRDDATYDVGSASGRPRDWYGGGAIANGVQRSSPATGASVTISDHISSLIITPAGTIATLTVTLPANPLNGQLVRIACTQIVTTLTLSGNSGQTLDGGLTAFAANGFATYQYVVADTTWYRVG